jgi:serine/threonine protein kinase
MPHVSLTDCASCRSQGKNHDPVLVDLIDKLLRLNPADRLTAEQVHHAAPISHMTIFHTDT